MPNQAIAYGVAVLGHSADQSQCGSASYTASCKVSEKEHHDDKKILIYSSRSLSLSLVSAARNETRNAKEFRQC